MKKTKLFISLLAATMLASCGASTDGGGSTSKPTPTSESGQTTEVTPTSTEQPGSSETEEEDDLIHPVLHVVIYERYVDQEILGPNLINAIKEYAKPRGYGLKNVTFDYVGGSKVADFQTNVIDAETKLGYKFDIILGGKAFSGCTYLNENFTSYKIDGAALDFPIGDSTDRRLWIRNETENDDLIPTIINFVRSLAGLPEEEDGPEVPPEESSDTTPVESSELPPEESSELPPEESSEVPPEESSELPPEESSEGEDLTITVGWWDSSKSGFTADITNNLSSGIEAALDSSELYGNATFSFRAYSQSKVGDLGSAINTDGDVDVFIGAASNLKSTGGVDYVTRTGPLTIGEADDRYIYLLRDNAIANFVYDFMVSEGGQGLLVTPAEPEESSELPPEESSEEEFLCVTVGWWNYSTSGLTAEIADNLGGGLAYMLSSSELYADANVRLRGYTEEKVGALGSAINTDGDVEIFIGAGGNLKSTGGVDYVTRTGPLTINGAENRYIYLLKDNALAQFVYDYMISDDGQGLLVPMSE